jgi:hypothetical protein
MAAVYARPASRTGPPIPIHPTGAGVGGEEGAMGAVDRGIKGTLFQAAVGDL